ncbi:hypothetical protein EON81_11650 [bacterium]|nr:MAG: hypothetical protein EON81_11650 [bacterium]
MRRAAPLLLLALVGCTRANKELLPYLGKWNGAFEVESLSGATDKDLKRETLRGYLVLYATNRRFVMHLEGEQQGMDLDGAWTIDGKQAKLKAVTFKIDDQGGEELRDPNRKWIPAADLKPTMEGQIVLNISADAQRLASPTTSIGARQGAFRFRRGD